MKIQGKEQVLGQLVRDSDGRRLGRVVGVQCGPDPYTATWFLVALSGWQRRLRAVPAAAATWYDRGGLQVAYRRGWVAGSPIPIAAGTGADFARGDLNTYYAAAHPRVTR